MRHSHRHETLYERLRFPTPPIGEPNSDEDGYLTEPWRSNTAHRQPPNPADFMVGEGTLMDAGRLTEKELADRKKRILYDEDEFRLDDQEDESEDSEKNLAIANEDHDEHEEKDDFGGHPHRHTKKCYHGCTLVWE